MNKELNKFYKEIGADDVEILQIVKDERTRGENYVQGERLSIEADLVLLRNQNKKEGMIGDTTLFNTHTALVARSYRNKSPVNFKGDKNGIERQIKMLNTAWKEDGDTPYMKALRYYKEFDKFAAGLAITAQVGWDGVYKRPLFQAVNPLLAVPDPAGDYFTGNYRYIGFCSIKTKEELEREGFDVDDLTEGGDSNGAVQQKINSQIDQGYSSTDTTGLYDIYIHFTHINGVKCRILTINNEQKILKAGIIQPGNSLQKKKSEAIQFPFAFHYRKPLRDNFFGDRIANYTRDVQIQKAIIANLRIDKMRAELYPMYLYNKDYVSGKDLAFGFNKAVPISTGIDGPQVNLQNIVAPIQKDLRIDTSLTVDQTLDRQVEKSTSIGDIVQGTTPDKRETLGTNQLVVSNTDVNLSLNEELDAIGDQQLVQLWFSAYYQNFDGADTKLVFAGSGTSQTPIQLKRKDFIYEGNMALSIETNTESEVRKKKQALAYQITAPLILQDQSINEGSKRATLRRIAEANGISDEDIDVEIPKTPHQMKQMIENDLLNMGIYIEISPDDDDEQHLIEMGSISINQEWEAHKSAHIQATIDKGTMIQQPQQNNGMLNSAMNQGVAMANQEQTQLNNSNLQ